MGWTSCVEWQTKKDVVNELIRQLRDQYIIRASKSTTQAWYAVVEDKATAKRSIFIALIESSKSRYGCAYKDMDEASGPYVNDCPLTFFDMVSEAPNDYAHEFRARCRAFHAKKAARKGKTRYFILGLYVDGQCVACKLAKPIGNSKRRFSIDEMQPLYGAPGTLKNLGAFYK